MAYLADLIVDKSPTGSDGNPVTHNGADADGYNPYGLLVRPIGGPFSITLADPPLPVTFPDYSLDAFGRQRFTQPYTIFDSKQLYSGNDLFWSDMEVDGTSTSSSFNENQASTSLFVSNLTSGRRVHESRRTMVCQPGKSQLVLMTANFHSGSTGVTKRVGYFTDNNGIFFEISGSQLNAVVRSNTTGVPIDTRVAQENFNGDKMNGSGVSGMNFDYTRAQIFWFDFQWLGVGTVRMGMSYSGSLITAHSFHHANNVTKVFMSSPNLKTRYEILNDGTGPAEQIDAICASVFSEGGGQEIGALRSVNRGSTQLDGTNTTSKYPLLAIRLQSGKIWTSVNIQRINVVVPTNAAFLWELTVNPTITGSALTYTPLNNSSVEYCGTATNGTTILSGSVIASGYQTNRPATIDVNLKEFFLGTNAVGTSDVIVLAIKRLNGGAGDDFFGSIDFREET